MVYVTKTGIRISGAGVYSKPAREYFIRGGDVGDVIELSQYVWACKCGCPRMWAYHDGRLRCAECETWQSFKLPTKGEAIPLEACSDPHPGPDYPALWRAIKGLFSKRNS